MSTNVSKIKSVNLDKWKPEWIELFKYMNNSIANSYLEANLPSGFRKPTTNSDSHEVKRFLKEKYIDMKYAAKGKEPGEMFYSDKQKFLKKIKKWR
jgi:stromal membrane-associated protein